MKLSEALIAWNPGTDQVRVGRLLEDGDPDWTESPIRYDMTAGAAYTGVRKLTGIEARHYVMSEFIGLVVRDRVDLDAAHQAFLAIDDYRQAVPDDLATGGTRYER